MTEILHLQLVGAGEFYIFTHTHTCTCTYKNTPPPHTHTFSPSTPVSCTGPSPPPPPPGLASMPKMADTPEAPTNRRQTMYYLNTQADRQTDRQTDRQADTLTNKQLLSTCMQAASQSCLLIPLVPFLYSSRAAWRDSFSRSNSSMSFCITLMARSNRLRGWGGVGWGEVGSTQSHTVRKSPHTGCIAHRRPLHPQQSIQILRLSTTVSPLPHPHPHGPTHTPAYLLTCTPTPIPTHAHTHTHTHTHTHMRTHTHTHTHTHVNTHTTHLSFCSMRSFKRLISARSASAFLSPCKCME